MLLLARRTSPVLFRMRAGGALLLAGCTLAGVGCGSKFSDAEYREVHYDDTTEAVTERLGDPDVVNDEQGDLGYEYWHYYSDGTEYRLGFFEGKVEDRYDDPCLDQDCSAERLAAQD